MNLARFSATRVSSAAVERAVSNRRARCPKVDVLSVPIASSANLAAERFSEIEEAQCRKPSERASGSVPANRSRSG